jgi:hypothetical protein
VTAVTASGTLKNGTTAVAMGALIYETAIWMYLTAVTTSTIVAAVVALIYVTAVAVMPA